MKKSAKPEVNRINPNKLLLSKWTSLCPKQNEKHFLVNRIDSNEKGVAIFCTLEAILSRAEYLIHWQALKNAQHWRPGWH